MASDKTQARKQQATTNSSGFKRIVRCPSCNGDSVYSEANPHRPFCCARCKNHDLGAWAAEAFRVSATPAADESDPGESNLQ